ncbi:MAG: type II toxin-antitoxin system Phd/YefM family antitoxin [Bacteroidetes bacterium]|nr:type II toxin-antitoxin system Phd/YefM family antitoxin [Bacteroidota bacterium]
MPTIRPISDLKNKSNEISKYVRNSSEPVFITKDGKGEMVVMSITHYNQMQKRLELFSKLAAAETQRASGNKGRTLNSVMKDIKRKIRA